MKRKSRISADFESWLRAETRYAVGRYRIQRSVAEDCVASAVSSLIAAGYDLSDGIVRSEHFNLIRKAVASRTRDWFRKQRRERQARYAAVEAARRSRPVSGELRAALSEAIYSLDSLSAAVVSLRLRGYEFRAIADMFGMTPAAVRQRYSRSLGVLRTHLKSYRAGTDQS